MSNPRIEQLNAAGAELNAAVEAIRTAGADADMTALETRFADAQREFERAQHNADLYDVASGVKTFAPVQTENPNTVGMDERDVAQFSILRAIRAKVSGDWSGASLEREVSDAIAEKLGRSAQGFFIPTEVQRRGFDNEALRRSALTVGTATAGGNLVGTDLMGGSFIDLLRNSMVTNRAGATLLTGLQGNVAIPRQSGGATYYWVGENTAPTSGAQTFDQVTLTPKIGGAYTDISRLLLNQSSVDVEALVTRDLALACALGLDYAALHGSGSNSQPSGVAAFAGIGSVVGGTSGAAATWANIVALETEVATDNADIGNLAYITNAKVRGKLKSTPVVANESKMVWDASAPDAPLNGYKAYVTNQVRSDITKNASNLSAAFFGNWADLLIGSWGTVDILVDPYTGSSAGTLRVVALQDVDIAVRHAESFAAMLDIVTT